MLLKKLCYIFVCLLSVTTVKAVTANDSLRYDYFFQGAMAQMAAGNTPAAMELLRHCISIRPDAAEAYYYMAQGYKDEKNDSMQVMMIKKAAALEPANATYKEALVPIYLNAKDLDNAISVMEDIVKRTPERTDMLNILLQVYNYKSDFANSLKTLNRIETQEGVNEETTMQKVQIYTNLGKDSEALKELKELCTKHPLDLNYRVMLGNWLLGKNRKKEALAEYQSVLKEDPDNEMGLLSMYDYYNAEGDKARADQQVDRILMSKDVSEQTRTTMLGIYVREARAAHVDSTEILKKFDLFASATPKDLTPLRLKAAYMSNIGMPDDSIAKILHKVLEKDPTDKSSRLFLIQMAWSKMNADKMIEVCKPAIEYLPKEWTFSYYLAIAYFIKEDYENCVKTIENVREIIDPSQDKKIAASMYGLLGDCYYKLHRNKDAYAAYEDCLEIDPDNIECLNNYAYYLSEEDKDLDKAAEMSLKTIKAEPMNSTYLDTYAWIVYKQGRYEEAAIYMDMALKYLPKDADATEYKKHEKAIKERIEK